MGGTLAKLLVGAFFVALSAQLGELARELIGRARESVQASELLTIDGQLATWAVDQRRTRAPRDQQEFERALRDLVTARGGRDVVLDRWGQPYLYERLGDQPAWRLSSRGPDRTPGTADDLVVERRGDRVERSRDPQQIAEQALERKRGMDRQVLRELQQLTARLEGAGAGDEAGLDAGLLDGQQAGETLAQLDRLLGSLAAR